MQIVKLFDNKTTIGLRNFPTLCSNNARLPASVIEITKDAILLDTGTTIESVNSDKSSVILCSEKMLFERFKTMIEVGDRIEHG